MSSHSEAVETALTALRYLEVCLSTHQNPEAFWDKNILASLEKHTNDPLNLYVMSLYAYHLGNYEGAAFAAGLAMLRDHGFKLAQNLFLASIGKLGRTPQDYLAILSKDQDVLVNDYRTIARQYFDDGNLVVADSYIQRANGLRHIIRTGMHPLENVLAQTREYLKTGVYEKEIEKWEQQKIRQFNTGKYRDMPGLCAKWLDSPNKKQIAKYVVDTLKAPKTDSPVCVELGANMGALLHLIEKEASGLDMDVELIGIEQDKQPIDYARKWFPSLTIYQGNHESMISGNIKLPKDISVFLLSFVCEINRCEMVEDIIRFASKRCKQIVIAADLCNMDGDISVIRSPYLLHPYRRILESNGFQIKELTLLAKPTPAATGILWASIPSLPAHYPRT